MTPVYGSETLSRITGRKVSLKAENLQRTGSFKIRGAANKLSTLTESERRAGVVAASAGNHGQAVAWAAREAGVKATVFMPQDRGLAFGLFGHQVPDLRRRALGQRDEGERSLGGLHRAHRSSVVRLSESPPGPFSTTQLVTAASRLVEPFSSSLVASRALLTSGSPYPGRNACSTAGCPS